MRGRAVGRARALVLPVVLAVASACSARGPGAEAYPGLTDYAGDEVVALRFVAPAPFGADSLAELIRTTTTHCNFPCIFGWGRTEAFLDLDLLAADVSTLELFYRRNGFFGTRVMPDVLERGEDEIAVQFTILRGDSIVLDSLVIDGVAEVLDTAAVRNRLPLEEGQLFKLDEFLRSAEILRQRLYNSGYANAEVLRNYAVDTLANTAFVELIGIPGPQVRVDSIIVAGGHRLGRSTTLRQLTFRQGDLLQPPALAASQRNLFALDLVQFATVTTAPDSLQLSPADDSTETILVTVQEGPVYVVEAATGWGSVDCFRAQASWTSRSFLGGARRLNVSGSVSKIGIGDPVDLGLGGTLLCDEYEQDPFASSLDYRLATDVTQPYFLSPNNRLNATLYVQRQSEPNLFQRQAYGADFTFSRRIGLRDALSAVLSGQYRRTLATEAVFCFALAVCQRSDLVGLDDFQWRNSIGANYTRDRTDVTLAPTRGYTARVGLEYAPAWTGSDIEFLRGSAEGAYYFTLRPSWIVATHLRVGDFFGSTEVLPDSAVDVGDLLPPEERFYLGGATTVRGYERNAIGAELNPGVYVAEATSIDSVGDYTAEGADIVFVPLGGTSLLLANAELRLPSPFLSQYLRFVTFVDAGAISTGSIADIEFGDLRVTPGVGVRIQTPVGPARIDVAWRAYDRYTAPLLGPDPDVSGQLVQIQPAYQPEDSFWQKLQFHLAVGHAF